MGTMQPRGVSETAYELHPGSFNPLISEMLVLRPSCVRLVINNFVALLVNRPSSSFRYQYKQRKCRSSISTLLSTQQARQPTVYQTRWPNGPWLLDTLEAPSQIETLAEAPLTSVSPRGHPPLSFCCPEIPEIFSSVIWHDAVLL